MLDELVGDGHHADEHDEDQHDLDVVLDKGDRAQEIAEQRHADGPQQAADRGVEHEMIKAKPR